MKEDHRGPLLELQTPTPEGFNCLFSHETHEQIVNSGASDSAATFSPFSLRSKPQRVVRRRGRSTHSAPYRGVAASEVSATKAQELSSAGSLPFEMPTVATVVPPARRSPAPEFFKDDAHTTDGVVTERFASVQRSEELLKPPLPVNLQETPLGPMASRLHGHLLAEIFALAGSQPLEKAQFSLVCRDWHQATRLPPA